MYVDDLADASIFVMNNKTTYDMFNVGYGEDISIFMLSQIIKEIVQFDGEIIWDKSKPDGTYKKLLNSSKIRSLGWTPKVSLQQGVHYAYLDFLRNKTHA